MQKFQLTPNTQCKKKAIAFIDYVPAKFYPGTDCYVGYYVFDPISKTMIRKRIRLNHVGNKAEQRKVAVQMVKKINDQLAKGWNPLADADADPSFHSFDDAVTLYLKNLERSLSNRLIRKSTYDSYKSYCNIMILYNNERISPPQYMYQFNKDFVRDFLDYVYIERKNAARTRDGYLGFLRHFSSFCKERGFIEEKP